MLLWRNSINGLQCGQYRWQLAAPSDGTRDAFAAHGWHVWRRRLNLAMATRQRKALPFYAITGARLMDGQRPGKIAFGAKCDV
jgi:hypothetical protein